MLKFWNGEDVKIKAQQFISKSVLKAGLIFEGQAKVLCPKDEGTLRNSIETKQIDDNKVEVGTDVEYGIYQEFGTRKMRPHPFMRPTLDIMQGKPIHLIAQEGKYIFAKYFNEWKNR